MCFGSKQPVMPQAPEITPAPIPASAPLPSTIAPKSTEGIIEGRRRRLNLIRYGMMSTIKTGGSGITGAGVDLASTGSGKTTLGA